MKREELAQWAQILALPIAFVTLIILIIPLIFSQGMRLQELIQGAQILALPVAIGTLIISIIDLITPLGSEKTSEVFLNRIQFLKDNKDKIKEWIRRSAPIIGVGISSILIFVNGFYFGNLSTGIGSQTSTPIPTETLIAVQTFTSTPTPTSTSTPTPTFTPTSTPTPTETPITPTPTSTSTPTPTPTPTSTPTPTFTPTETPTPSPTYTLTPSDTPIPPTLTSTPTATHTPNPLIGVIVTNSTMRSGANETSSVVGTAYKGERFTVLQLDHNEEWIRISIRNEKFGWVRRENVETDSPINVTPDASPTPVPFPPFLISGNDEDITERSIIDRLEARTERVYIFSLREQNNDLNITFLTRPITNKVTFAIYTERQYELYQSEDINSLTAMKVGHIDTRLDQDWVSWNGNLTRDATYYLRIVNNNDQQAIEYCLLPTHIESWDKCP